MVEYSCSDAHTERVARIQHQLGLRIYECRSLDAGIHFAVADLHAAFKHAAHDAFLLPGLPFFDFAIGVKAGQLRAGSSSAGRTIISLTRTQDEIPAVDT